MDHDEISLVSDAATMTSDESSESAAAEYTDVHPDGSRGAAHRTTNCQNKTQPKHRRLDLLHLGFRSRLVSKPSCTDMVETGHDHEHNMFTS